MTAAATTAAPVTAPAARITWRRLTWVTWRQHRTGMAWVLGAFALAAVIMAVSGLTAHSAEAGQSASHWASGVHYFGYYAWLAWSPLIMQGFPIAAGLFLGAPLLAREAETGTVALAWTQGADRSRWLIAKVLPMTVLLGLAAFGLATELSWFVQPRPLDPWSPLWFDLNPLPFAGWTMLAFTLGVLLGGVIRRTVGAMGALTAGYLVLASLFAWLRNYYLPPLRSHWLWPGPQDGATYWRELGGTVGTVVPKDLYGYVTWPNGQLYTFPRPPSPYPGDSWLVRHHMIWVNVYQPASRYALFGAIEFGWLVLLAVLLLAAAAIMIRRRST